MKMYSEAVPYTVFLSKEVALWQSVNGPGNTKAPVKVVAGRAVLRRKERLFDGHVICYFRPRRWAGSPFSKVLDGQTARRMRKGREYQFLIVQS